MEISLHKQVARSMVGLVDDDEDGDDDREDDDEDGAFVGDTRGQDNAEYR